MKLLLVIFILMSANAFSSDLCDSTRNASAAKKQLRYIEALAKKVGVADLVSSSGIESCNPKTFVIAAFPGEADSRVMLTDLCAPIFTFETKADMEKFAQTLRYVLPIGVVDSTCVQLNFVQPRK